MSRRLFSLLALFLVGSAAACWDLEDPVEPVHPDCEGPLCQRDLLDRMGAHPFYQKLITGGEIVILGSEKVSDDALVAAAEILDGMVGEREDVREALRSLGAYVAVIGRGERLTDIPGNSHLSTTWNETVRGLAGTPENPLTTVGEENLLCLADDMFRGESMLIRHFGLATYLLGIDFLDLDFRDELAEAWSAARDDGLWQGTEAEESPGAYWAEGVQSWFDANLEPRYGVETREDLRAYDARLAGLIETWLGDGTWRHECPTEPG